MFDDLQTEFGKLVRERRKEYGLTQKMTAEILEMSVYNLRKIEHCENGTNWVDWVKLGGLFSIDSDALQRKYVTPERLKEIGIDLSRLRGRKG